MPLELISNLDEVVGKFTALSRNAATGLRTAMNVTAGQVAAQGEAIVREHTPVGPGDGEHLRDTTIWDVTRPSADTLQITVRQTKTIPIKGKDVPLALVLRTGHEAPPNGIRPVNAGALFWPGLGHPVMFSKGGSAPPNPYAEDARAEFAPLAIERFGMAADGYLATLTELL